MNFRSRLQRLLVGCLVLLAFLWLANSYLRYSYMAEGRTMWRVDRWTGRVDWTDTAYSSDKWNPAGRSQHGEDAATSDSRPGELTEFFDEWMRQNP